MNFKQWLNKNENYIDTYNYPSEAMELAFNAGREQYKSLVKTVDADNLPDGEVLAIDSTKEVMLSSYLWADAFGTVWAENDIENMNVITHYIEQKDLIKMISGV
tara:strand:+ start:162 stop:473 length:312 start_codon:yes stop_codon:yes gene_type:complete